MNGLKKTNMLKKKKKVWGSGLDKNKVIHLNVWLNGKTRLKKKSLAISKVNE